jgi:hypothetical protein
MESNWLQIFSLVFGSGGIAYGVIVHFLTKKKFDQEVRSLKADADLKGDNFWKQRYDTLQGELDSRDNWWKERYDKLDKDYEEERRTNIEMVKNFRSEINQMRTDYETQRDSERQRYDALLNQYREFERESERKEQEYKSRITKLEFMLSKYERKIVGSDEKK